MKKKFSQKISFRGLLKNFAKTFKAILQVFPAEIAKQLVKIFPQI